MNSLHRQVRWSAIFAVNLIVPLLFACSVVRGRAWIGVSLAVAGYWLAGICVCRKNGSITQSLLIGGAIVALSQFWPCLQMFAGLIALGEHFNVTTGVIGGFLATAITGGILLTVATLVGLPFARRKPSVVDEAKPLGKLPSFDDEIDG